MIRGENTAFQADLEDYHAKDAIYQGKIEPPRPRNAQCVRDGKDHARAEDKHSSKRKAPDSIRRRQANQDKEAHEVGNAPHENKDISPTIGIVAAPVIARGIKAKHLMVKVVGKNKKNNDAR